MTVGSSDGLDGGRSVLIAEVDLVRSILEPPPEEAAAAKD
jgi:hypothetical protein